MYVERVPNRNSAPAVLLRESYREDGRVKKRTIANLSKWSPEKVAALQSVLRGKPVRTTSKERASKREMEQLVKKRFELLRDHLNERERRLVAASEAETIGEGGISIVARATGLSRDAVRRGLAELRGAGEEPAASGRIRRPGGGRPRTVDKDPTLLADLESLIEPSTLGDPESPLRWTSKSLRRLAEELRAMDHQTSHRMVGELLRGMGYSLQANRKTREGADHPDRDAQFNHLNEKVKDFLAADDPVISVDTKKKELVGDFKNDGKEWRPKGKPEEVRVHDFVIKELGRAIPYGVYDLATNTGWVSVGTDHDTAEFAVETIRRWWDSMGAEAHPHAERLLITADGGGSNGSRVRLWKIQLQALADELGMPISVCHLPPGTSKWNRIEHRLFSFITQNWRGKPLISHEVIVKLIAGTTTSKGLKVKAELNENSYQAGIKVSNDELAAVNIERDEFHGEWNYTIMSRFKKK